MLKGRTFTEQIYKFAMWSKTLMHALLQIDMGLNITFFTDRHGFKYTILYRALSYTSVPARARVCVCVKRTIPELKGFL